MFDVMHGYVQFRFPSKTTSDEESFLAAEMAEWINRPKLDCLNK